MTNRTHDTSYTRTRNESRARSHIKRASNRKMRREWLTTDERNALYSLRHVLPMDDEQDDES